MKEIKFSKYAFDKQEEEAVLRAMRSGWIACGPETEAFEKEFADYVGAKYAIFTNSCTSALKMAYKWAREQGHRAVMYPQNTFCGTYSAAIECDLSAISQEDGLRMEVLKYLCEAHKDENYGAMVNVHYGSVKDETPCLIEDSAHRIEPNDPLVGKIRCYSFYVTKNMTTVTGGMFVTNDKEIYERARLYWRDGITKSTADRAKGSWDYKVVVPSGGYDGDDVRAAIGRVQLKKLPEFTKRRNEIVKMYNQAFGQEWTGNHLYPYFLESVDDVPSFIKYMADNGIACGYHYPGTGWKGVSLPLYPLLTDNEVNRIIDETKKWRK